jgi:hypothetical protein
VISWHSRKYNHQRGEGSVLTPACRFPHSWVLELYVEAEPQGQDYMQALSTYAKQLAERKGRHILVPSRLEHASFYQRYFTNLKQYTPAHFSEEPAVSQYVLFGYGTNAGKHCTKPEVYFLYPYEASMSAWHLSSQNTCELHLSRDSSSLAYSSWLCI